MQETDQRSEAGRGGGKELDWVEGEVQHHKALTNSFRVKWAVPKALL